jgi:hypothetical protein
VWWETQHISWTNNRTSTPRIVKQFGGTALFSINQAAHRVIDKVWDKTNLGRWTWARYQGKNMQSLRIVVAYRPNPPQGPFSVYAQKMLISTLSPEVFVPEKAF